jgi:DNA mismatch repair ATPase MutS
LSKKESSSFEEYIRSDDERTDFVRSQTLKSAERYVSTYLSTLQTKIEEASQQLHEKEQALLL